MIDAAESGFSQTGGARIDSWNFTFPFAALSAHRNAITLNDYVFPKESIISLARHRGLFSVGLRISHTVPLYPKFVVFWISAFRVRTPFERLQKRLEALGYEVLE